MAPLSPSHFLGDFFTTPRWSDFKPNPPVWLHMFPVRDTPPLAWRGVVKSRDYPRSVQFGVMLFFSRFCRQ